MRALVLGLSMGLAAGISPGPLLVLVITSALRSGWRTGVIAACAPLLTDLLVVTAALLVLDGLPDRALAALGVAGGTFVIWTAGLTVREAHGAALAAPAGAGASVLVLRRASVVNLLSPHPWLTWATALGPLTVATWREQPGGAVALVAGFYAALVGAKSAAAWVVAGGRRRLSDAGYRVALAVAGMLLALAGLALVAEFGPGLF